MARYRTFLSVCALSLLLSAAPAVGQEAERISGNPELLRRLQASAGGDALPLRHWIALDYEMDYLRRVMALAPEFNVNAIQLSHSIGMYAENVINDREREQNVRELIDLGHQNGLLMYYWVHEIGPLPEEFKGPHDRVPLDESLWDFIRDKYRKFFDLVPDLDGVVLTLHETEYSVYDELKVASELSRVERTVLLIDRMAEICGQYDKTLIVRTFAHTTDQVEWIGEALQTIAARAEAPDNLVVMSKCTPHDWQFYYPHNPFIGNVGGLVQIVEFDMGGEYWGSNVIPACFPEYYHYRLSYGRSRGISGAAARIERGKPHALGNPGEVNLFAFGKFLTDPEADPDAVFLEWCEQKYGTEAAPLVRSALGRSFEILSYVYFPRRSWVNPHSSLPNIGYTEYVLNTHDAARWDPHPGLVALKEELLRPTEGTITIMRGEKQRALELIDRSIEDIENARAYLTAEDYAFLSEQFAKMKYVAMAFRDQNELIFRLRQYGALKERDPDSAEVERLRQEIIRQSDTVLETANRIEQRLGQDMWPGNPRNMRALVNSPAVRRFRRHLMKRPEYLCLRRDAKIEIDGDLSDWQAIPALTLDRPDQAKYVRSWRGPDDLSGWLYMVWDDESLYTAARVRDDMHRTKQTSRGPEGDLLMLGFDFDLDEREFDWEEDDVVLEIVAVEHNTPHLRLKHGNVTLNPEIAVRVDGETTLYEARFGWGNIGFSPTADAKIGFSAAVIDLDTVMHFRDGYLQWTDGFVEDRDAASWGKVILSRKTKP